MCAIAILHRVQKELSRLSQDSCVMHKTIMLRQRLVPTAILLCLCCLPLQAGGREDEKPADRAAKTTASPVEVGVGGRVRQEDARQSIAEERQPMNVHARWESRYVTEGRDNLDGDGLMSATSDIPIGDFTLAPWLAHSPDSEYTESNFNLIYGFVPTNRLEVYGGYTYLHSRVPDDGDNDHEAFLDVVYTPTDLFDLLGSGYHSFEADGTFWTLALRRRQRLNAKTVLTLRSGVGFNDEYVSHGHDGWNHVQLRLNLAHYPLHRLEVTSYLAYSIALDRDPTRFPGDANLRDLFWGGIGVVYHF